MDCASRVRQYVTHLIKLLVNVWSSCIELGEILIQVGL